MILVMPVPLLQPSCAMLKQRMLPGMHLPHTTLLSSTRAKTLHQLSIASF